MKNKIVTLLITSILILVLISTTVSASTIPEITSITSEEKQQLTSNPTNEGSIQMTTTGPVWQTIQFADVTFIDGPILKITFIARLLNSRNLFFMLPLLTINIKDVAFSVKYRFNTPNVPILKRFSYSTRINESGNMSIYNEKHTVIVSGFDGQFILYRAKPFRLTPAQFGFIGTCDDVIVN